MPLMRLHRQYAAFTKLSRWLTTKSCHHGCLYTTVLLYFTPDLPLLVWTDFQINNSSSSIYNRFWFSYLPYSFINCYWPLWVSLSLSSSFLLLSVKAVESFSNSFIKFIGFFFTTLIIIIITTSHQIICGKWTIIVIVIIIIAAVGCCYRRGTWK